MPLSLITLAISLTGSRVPVDENHDIIEKSRYCVLLKNYFPTARYIYTQTNTCFTHTFFQTELAFASSVSNYLEYIFNMA